LIEKQRKFDHAPTNSVIAYKYFRELNRQHKFHTVVRLYEKYEPEYRSNKGADFSLHEKVIH
jgi:hypothetical protein